MNRFDEQFENALVKGKCRLCGNVAIYRNPDDKSWICESCLMRETGVKTAEELRNEVKVVVEGDDKEEKSSHSCCKCLLVMVLMLISFSLGVSSLP